MPLILLNKPCRVLSQFRDNDGRTTLADLVTTPSVYPAGRLDYDSEGLLLLTDDGRLQSRISEPAFKLVKNYWVQVEGAVTESVLTELTEGMVLKDGAAAALSATEIDEPRGIWARHPPIRERRLIPTSWLDIAIDVGRTRLVRRMTAAVGLPTLRLVRHRIGPWSLEGLSSGQTRELANDAAWQQLRRFSGD
jgi:23S rRNA pseudouridine2457 synthase